MIKPVRFFGIMGIVVGLLIAGAVSAAAQGLLPRRTLGSRLARPAQTASHTADAAKDREDRKARAAQRSQFSAGSSTAAFERERDTLFMDIVREAEICQTNLAMYATYPYWPDAMGVVSNFCEKENCVVVDVGHHFGSWRQSSWWQGSGKKAYVVRCDLVSESRFVPQHWRKAGFCVISRGGSYTNFVYGGVGSVCCYDSDGRFVEMYDSLDKIPGMKQCFDDELKVNYGEQDRWMKAHAFAEEGSGRDAELKLDAARTNVIGRLKSLRTILSSFPQWWSDNKWHGVGDVGVGMRGPCAYGEQSRSRPLLEGLRRPGSKPAVNIETNDAVLVRMNERFECLGRKQDKLIEMVVRGLTGLEFGVPANTNGVLDLKFNLGGYETCTFDRVSGEGVVSSVKLIAEFDPSCEQKMIHEKLDQGLSMLLSAIGMDRYALAYGARPLQGRLLRPGGNQDWKSVRSFSQRFLISRSKQQSGEYVVTICDQRKKDAECQAQAARDAERQAQAEWEKVQRDAERAEQRLQLLRIQEELKRIREAKAAAAENEGVVDCATDKSVSDNADFPFRYPDIFWSYWVRVGGALYTKDVKRLVACLGGDKSLVIPEGVTEIGNGAFRDCRGLRSVTMPSSIIQIENTAFLSSGLTSVTIPASVKNIGESAFEDCRHLASVTMRGECPFAGNKVFSRCEILKTIHVPATCKSWAGMKEWQGIPLVFDEAVKK